MGKLLGSRYPRLSSIPQGDGARGEAAVQFARWAGMTLFPWQEDVLRAMCATRPDGKWAAREAVICVPRQNGKGEILVARELAGIYLFGERNILHTAHFLDTAVDARDRLWDIIENNDDLYYWWEDQGVPRLVKTNGKEAIVFPCDEQPMLGAAEEETDDELPQGITPRNGSIRFRTRTDKTGRGLSIDLLIFDECFNLPHETHAAISKTTRAKKHAQTIFISSPVNKAQHMHGAVFSAKRWAGIDGADGTLFMEWSADPDQVDIYSDEALIQANPSLTTGEYGAQLDDARQDAESARNSEALRDAYMVETLGIGDWVPRDNDESDFAPIIAFDVWENMLCDAPKITKLKEIALGIDININGDVCAMVAAMKTTTGVHLSLADRVLFDRDQLLDELRIAVEINDPLAAAIDVRGPSSTIERGIRDIGVEPTILKARDITKGYMLLKQLVEEHALTHDGDPRWVEALRVVEEREIGEWGKAIKRVKGEGCPLVAAAFAILALDKEGLQEVVPMRAKKTFNPVAIPTKVGGRPNFAF